MPDLRRVSVCELGPVEHDRPAGRGPKARDRLGELALSVSGDACDRDDLAGVDLEAEPAHGRGAPVAVHLQVCDLEAGDPADVAGGGSSEDSVVPDHHLGELVGGDSLRRDGADLATRPENRDPIGELEHLADLVRDEDEAPAVRDHLAEDGEQIVDLLRREHRGRFVEDEQRRVPVERLDDLDPLSLADRELPDHGVGVDDEPVALGQLADPRGDGAEVGERPARRPEPERDVLGDRERVHEHEVLVDHPDPVRDRICGRGDADRQPVQPDLALVGLVEAVEHAHQRALAGPVLTEQRVHLAGADVEVDAVVGDHAGKPLRDAPHLQQQGGSIRSGSRSSLGRLIRRAQCPFAYAGTLIEPSLDPGDLLLGLRLHGARRVCTRGCTRIFSPPFLSVIV